MKKWHLQEKYKKIKKIKFIIGDVRDYSHLRAIKVILSYMLRQQK